MNENMVAELLYVYNQTITSWAGEKKHQVWATKWRADNEAKQKLITNGYIEYIDYNFAAVYRLTYKGKVFCEKLLG